MSNQKSNNNNNGWTVFVIIVVLMGFLNPVLGALLFKLFITLCLLIVVLGTVIASVKALFGIKDTFKTTTTTTTTTMSTEDYLRSLVKDDAAVDRLIRDSRRKYANRHYIWHIEKVTEDWLRDRR